MSLRIRALNQRGKHCVHRYFILHYSFSPINRTYGVHEIWDLLGLQHDLRSKFNSLDRCVIQRPLIHVDRGRMQPGCHKPCFYSVYIEDFIRRTSKRPEMFVSLVCAWAVHMYGAAELLKRLERGC